MAHDLATVAVNRECGIELWTESREYDGAMRDPKLRPLQRQVEVRARPWRTGLLVYILASMALFLTIFGLDNAWGPGIVGAWLLTGRSGRALQSWQRHHLDLMLELSQLKDEFTTPKEELEEQESDDPHRDL